MRVLVTGSRDWECPDLAEEVLNRLLARYGPFVLVSGGCPTGVDRCFEEAAGAMGLVVERHPADWRKHGRGAGPKRNAAMVALGADLCVAVARDLGVSRGTRDCAGRAHAAGIPTYVVGEGGVARRFKP